MSDDESVKSSDDTERENPFEGRGTNDLERVTCQHEEDCEAPANLWATWPEDRELTEDGTPVCHTHADELDRSGESVLFTTMTASERYVLTGTERHADTGDCNCHRVTGCCDHCKGGTGTDREDKLSEGDDTLSSSSATQRDGGDE